MCVCVCAQLLSQVWLFATPWTGLLCLWNFPGKNIGVACHFLLQGIFLTQESNPYLWSLLHWQAVFTTEPPGKPHYKMIANALYISASYILLNIIFPETNILLRSSCVLPFSYSSHLVLDDMTTKTMSLRGSQCFSCNETTQQPLDTWVRSQILQNFFYHRDLYYTILLLVGRKILTYLCPQTLTFERELVTLLKSNVPVSVASSVSYLSLRHCISYGLCCITQKLGNSSHPDSSRCCRVNQHFVLSFFFFLP